MWKVSKIFHNPHRLRTHDISDLALYSKKFAGVGVDKIQLPQYHRWNW